MTKASSQAANLPAPNLPVGADLNLMQSRAEQVSQLLKTMGNAQRLRVLCLLLGEEMSVGQINEQLPDLSQSALSQHLARLREEGIVQTRREAQSVWYSMPAGPAQAIIGTLYKLYCAPAGDSKPAKPKRCG